MSLSRIVMRLARNPGTEFAGGDDWYMGNDVAPAAYGAVLRVPSGCGSGISVARRGIVKRARAAARSMTAAATTAVPARPGAAGAGPGPDRR